MEGDENYRSRRNISLPASRKMSLFGSVGGIGNGRLVQWQPQKERSPSRHRSLSVSVLPFLLLLSLPPKPLLRFLFLHILTSITCLGLRFRLSHSCDCIL